MYTNNTSLLRMPQVEQRTGLKKSAIYALEAQGQFPRHAKIGSASAWSSIEIEEWIAERLAEREARAA